MGSSFEANQLSMLLVLIGTPWGAKERDGKEVTYMGTKVESHVEAGDLVAESGGVSPILSRHFPPPPLPSFAHPLRAQIRPAN